MKLIAPRKTYSYDEHGNLVEFDRSADIDGYQFGDKWVSWAGAPGCGKVVYEVIQVDEQGVWGIELENTIRELDPSEVY